MRAAQVLQGLVMQLQIRQALAGGGALEVEAAMQHAHGVVPLELAEAVYAVFQITGLQTSGQLAPR